MAETHTHTTSSSSAVGGPTLQIRPLKDRLSKHQQEKRAAKIQARSTVANEIKQAIGFTQAFAIRTHQRVVVLARVQVALAIALVLLALYVAVIR